MARFLVDESLPRRTSQVLAAAGHDVADVREIGLRGADDEAVAQRARDELRILLTSDLDFANALRFPPDTHAGIVVLRVGDDWNGSRRAARLAESIEEAGAENLTGKLTIVEPARIRTFGVARD